MILLRFVCFCPVKQLIALTGIHHGTFVLALWDMEAIGNPCPLAAFVDVVWGPPRCVWARESTAPAQGNQSLSRELLASALCPGLEAQFPARRREERGCGPVTGKEENHPSPVTSDLKHKDFGFPVPTTTPIISQQLRIKTMQEVVYP